MTTEARTAPDQNMVCEIASDDAGQLLNFEQAKGQADGFHHSINKPFPFMRLPREIRNLVYKQCLTPYWLFNINVRNESGQCIVQKTDPEPDLRVNILALNRQIHNEAVRYLYEQEIHFVNPLALNHFVMRIGPSNRSYLRRITFCAIYHNGSDCLYEGFGTLCPKAELVGLYILREDEMPLSELDGTVFAERVFGAFRSWLKYLLEKHRDCEAVMAVLDVGPHVFGYESNKHEIISAGPWEPRKEAFDARLRDLLRGMLENIEHSSEYHSIDS